MEPGVQGDGSLGGCHERAPGVTLNHSCVLRSDTLLETILERSTEEGRAVVYH
jgi:hypothetical protein